MTGIQNVGVVGAGLMGGEIALVHALHGCDVILVDRENEILDRAMDRLDSVFSRGVTRGTYEEKQRRDAFARIRPATGFESLVDRDMVTEAVFESESSKADVLNVLSTVCKPTCIIATNTSTIPISSLASHLPSNRRQLFLGTHYFSPVSRMMLVEVIGGFETEEATTTAVISHLRALGKTPIRVKDVAGFAVNRMLHALIIEAVRLVSEGVASPQDLDTACRLGLGHAMGPFELMDAVTSALCVQAQEIMFEAYGERFRPPALLKQRVRAGFIGGKGNKGWKQSSES